MCRPWLLLLCALLQFVWAQAQYVSDFIKPGSINTDNVNVIKIPKIDSIFGAGPNPISKASSGPSSTDYAGPFSNDLAGGNSETGNSRPSLIPKQSLSSSSTDYAGPFSNDPAGGNSETGNSRPSLIRKQSLSPSGTGSPGPISNDPAGGNWQTGNSRPSLILEGPGKVPVAPGSLSTGFSKIPGPGNPSLISAPNPSLSNAGSIPNFGGISGPSQIPGFVIPPVNPNPNVPGVGSGNIGFPNPGLPNVPTGAVVGPPKLSLPVTAPIKVPGVGVPVPGTFPKGPQGQTCIPVGSQVHGTSETIAGFQGRENIIPGLTLPSIPNVNIPSVQIPRIVIPGIKVPGTVTQTASVSLPACKPTPVGISDALEENENVPPADYALYVK